MNSKEKVFKFVDGRFSYTKLIDVPLLPGGTRVVMPDGSDFVVSYDFLKNEIVEHFASGEKRTPWFVVSGEDPQGYYPAGI